MQRQVFKDDDQQWVVLQVIDTSAKVQIDREKTDKFIMSMVNATVNHELRNPINSIHCQNIMIKSLIKKIDDLLDNTAHLTYANFQERLIRLKV